MNNIHQCRATWRKINWKWKHSIHGVPIHIHFSLNDFLLGWLTRVSLYVCFDISSPPGKSSINDIWIKDEGTSTEFFNQNLKSRDWLLSKNCKWGNIYNCYPGNFRPFRNEEFYSKEVQLKVLTRDWMLVIASLYLFFSLAMDIIVN